MKLVVLLTSILLISGCNQRLHNKNEATETKGDEKQSRLEVSEEMHNFGTLVSGEIVIWTIPFVNKGGKKLKIKSIETGCSCVDATADKAELDRNETGNLKVVFNTSGLYGQQFQPVRILTDQEGVFLDLAVAADIKNEQIQFNN